jgi:hypothetical protein
MIRSTSFPRAPTTDSSKFSFSYVLVVRACACNIACAMRRACEMGGWKGARMEPR